MESKKFTKENIEAIKAAYPEFNVRVMRSGNLIIYKGDDDKISYFKLCKHYERKTYVARRTYMGNFYEFNILQHNGDYYYNTSDEIVDKFIKSKNRLIKQ